MIEIVDYKPSWVHEFLEIGVKIRTALGARAFAIHHIGSTSVPNLAAKDVIDVQITVANLEPSVLKPLLENAGFVWRDDLIHDHTPPGLALPESELVNILRRSILKARGVQMFISDSRDGLISAIRCCAAITCEPTTVQCTPMPKSNVNWHSTFQKILKRITTSKIPYSMSSCLARTIGHR